MTNNGKVAGPQPIEEFLKWNPTMPRELIGNGVLYEGMKLILYGRYKTFKSMLAYWMLWRMRDGLDVLGMPVDKQGVSSLYIQAEIAEPLMWKRATSMSKSQPQVAANNNRQLLHIWNEMNLKLDTDEGLRLLDKWIAAFQPLDVVCIDPLYKFIQMDITSPAAVQYFQDRIDRMIAKYNTAFIIVAHPRKPPREGNDGVGNVDDLLGSSTWANWADTVFKVTRPANYPQDCFLLKSEGVSRHSEEVLPDITYTVDRKTLQFQTTIVV
jgi:RecA-family ATPase